jgi:uncharacterized membrane protein YeaQ/YmgE (transglycosylase-associated protein family)
MGVLSWILFGLLAGALGRLVVRGPHRIGCLATIVIGIGGALVGGLIGQVVLGHSIHFGWDLGPFLLAVVGSALLLLVLQAISGRRGRRW